MFIFSVMTIAVNLFQVTEIFVVLEFGCLILIGFFAFFWHWRSRKKQVKRKKNQKIISKKIQEHNENISILNEAFFKKWPAEDLISVLAGLQASHESTSQAQNEKLLENYLLPIARMKYASHSWIDRLQAVRIFALAAKNTDETYLLYLLKDKIPVIKYASAHILGKMASAKGVDQILALMNSSSRLLRHPFQDALRKGKEPVRKILLKYLEEEEDPKMRLNCIDLLKNHMDEKIFNLIQKDLNSDNKNLKIATIKALGHFQSGKSISA